MSISDYKEVQIIKHALQQYIKRNGATEKEIREEKKLLTKYEETAECLKESYNIK